MTYIVIWSKNIYETYKKLKQIHIYLAYANMYVYVNV